MQFEVSEKVIENLKKIGWQWNCTPVEVIKLVANNHEKLERWHRIGSCECCGKLLNRKEGEKFVRAYRKNDKSSFPYWLLCKVCADDGSLGSVREHQFKHFQVRLLHNGYNEVTELRGKSSVKRVYVDEVVKDV